VFRQSSGSSFDLELGSPGRITNHTQVWEEQNTPLSRVQTPYPVPDRSSDLTQDLDGHLRFDEHSWSSLYLEAEDISLRADQAQATLEGVTGPDWAERRLPNREIPPSAWYSQPLSPGQVAAGMAAGPQGFTFTLGATGVHRLVWHNATLQCATACVDSGGPSGVSLTQFGRIAFGIYSYIELTGSSGSLKGQGLALAAAAGGPLVGLELEGKLRLPEAVLGGTCPRGPCPDAGGKTFLASGNISMEGLSTDPNRPGRLQADMVGHFEDAAFDEAPSKAFLVPALLGGTLGLGLLGLLVRSLWAGFSRRSRPPALEHPRRQAIFDLVRDEPGLSFRELQRRLDFPVGTLQKHLKRLKDDRLVMTRQHRNTLRFFENSPVHQGSWKQTAPLRNPEARRLHDWLAAHPTNQAQLAQETASWGWTLAKTRRRLALLEEGGVLAVQRVGGRVFYRIVASPTARGRWKAQGPRTVLST
jgi:DNA-binding transcriptional ArsR family regulator